ncbi:MAG: PqqD family protein [Microcystis sp.]|jgi:hypothetical protein|nr:PqqD family protein [Microcystis sp. LE19-338.1B]MCZ8359024.1 PqqD family protein [Microcystis sp. LE19-388.1G]NCR70022.1 PqqD family protein [Microcystis aeruginosa LG13-12]
MKPIVRKENLIIQAVGEELIVYDQIRNTSHCLNGTAGKVWRYCNGENTVQDMARLLQKELPRAVVQDVDVEGLVWQALEDLENCHLIEGYNSSPAITERISRRKAMKTAALVGGFALGAFFPAIRSIVAPTPAMAGSPPKQQKSNFTIEP